MKPLTVPVLFFVFAFTSLQAKFPESFDEPLERIAFGSCNRQDLPQPLWNVISENEPDLWIWLGDNIYGDTEDMALFKAKYNQQRENLDYAKFRKRTPIIGTWDDHDYGINNGDASLPKKAESQQLALDFMDVPPDSPRRLREGIYGDYTFGPEGKQVTILLIDDRYFADPPGEESELLGEAQWEWLEKTLRESEAQLNIIASGIQILPTEQKYEKWANFPKTRQRLLDFIQEEKISGVVFITGDRHFHEMSLKDDEETPYPLFEITSSGLTHSWDTFPGEPNQYRANPVYRGLGFGLITIDWEKSMVHFEIRDKENRIKGQYSIRLGALTAP